MNFDEYWHSLVDRVYRGQAKLRGDEERFYRLSCIYGETMVDGIESYFERRFDEFAADMGELRRSGFAELASEYELARKVMFGATPLDRETVEVTVTRLLDEAEDVQPVLEELNNIYRRVIPQLKRLANYKYSMGLAAGFFRDA
jgi:hypothetical protein